MTTLHDSHAIGDDGPPPVLALLLAAVRAVMTVLHDPRTGVEEAADAIRAYTQVAGLDTADVHDRILAAIERTTQSPSFTGSQYDVRTAAFWAQEPKPGLQFAQPGGLTFTVVGTGATKRSIRLLSEKGYWSARQATRQGALVRLDLLHAPVTHYDAAPGAEEPDAVYQVCAHDGESWPCRVAVSAGIAPEPVATPAPAEFATEAPF